MKSKITSVLRLFKDTPKPFFPEAISAYHSTSQALIWRRIFILALLYVVSARLGLQLQFSASQATPVWPPSGVAIGLTFLFGVRLVPGVVIGAFVANFLDFCLKGYVLSDAVIAAGFISLGAMLEAWLALIMLRLLLGERFISDTSSDIVGFVGTIAVACLLSASVGVVTFVALGLLPFSLASSVFFTWWVGDVIGGLLFVPCLLLFLGTGSKSLPELGRMIAPVIWPLSGLVALSVAIFLSSWDLLFVTAQACLLLPILMLLTLRYGRVLMVLAVPVISLIAVIGTIKGLGPFARDDSQAELILSLVFVGTLVFSLLLLDAIQYERQCARQSLAEANLMLELRVLERTQLLERANCEFERSNKDLDDFAYIASHDLREPLRGIQNLIVFLKEDYGAQLSPEVNERLRKISAVADHLDHLVETLLFYSRVGRTEMAMAMVDLDQVVDDVLKSLTGCLPTETLEVRRPARLPLSYCDQARIGEVFQNLLSNALKYNDKPNKWIEIGAFEKEGETIFYVEDNGIGIQEKNYARVFHLFRRLHSQEKFGGGTGAGMTICQKIVERHGGRMWIESTPERGSRFCFTLKAGDGVG